MEKSSQKSFILDDWQISPLEGLLSRGDEEQRLEPKAMEVLVYFASRPGEVVTREELERDVWHGALVGYDAVTSTVIKLRKALGDDAREPRYIATIPKRGYKLVAPVSYSSDNESVAADVQADVDRDEYQVHSAHMRQTKAAPWFLAAAALVVLLTAGLAWFWAIKSPDSDNAKPAGDPGKPSIVVLPFENLGRDQKEDLLSDGITEDIITDLSRLSNLLVIASNTSSQYKNTNLQPLDIGKELKVSFLLKGSIRRLGDAVRVNVQLINVKTGFNAWAQRYDRKLAEVFAVQDEVTRRIVESIAVSVSSKEKMRLTHRATDNLKAYDLFQEGQRLFKIGTQLSSEQAYEMYRQAIELDPGYGRAYGAWAVALISAYRDGWTDSPMETLDRALQLAKKGVELDELTPQTHFSLGFVYLFLRDLDNAERAAENSIAVAPNYADGYGLLGVIKAWAGRAEESLKDTEKGMKLNPYYTAEYLLNMGLAHYTLGQYDTAISFADKAYERNQNYLLPSLVLIASYVKLDRQEDAEWIASQLMFRNPSLTVTNLKKTLPLAEKYRQTFFEGLHKAGVPE